MKPVISNKLKISRTISLIMMVLGVVLLTFMVTVEGEPGALPLLLLFGGSSVFLITRYLIKVQTSKER